MTTQGSHIKGWIKLADWKKVNFPDKCPFTGLKADTTEEYMIYNTSLFWKIMGILRWGQYILLNVPFHENGIRQLKKIRNKAIIKGFLIGLVVCIVSLILTATIMSITFYNFGRDELKSISLFLIPIGGSIAGFSLFLGPLLMYYRQYKRVYPLYFEKKGKNLWVKIRNNDYRRDFYLINELNVIADKNENDAILDD
jgi:hypothetical protein